MKTLRFILRHFLAIISILIVDFCLAISPLPIIYSCIIMTLYSLSLSVLIRSVELKESDNDENNR